MMTAKFTVDRSPMEFRINSGFLPLYLFMDHDGNDTAEILDFANNVTMLWQEQTRRSMARR